MLAVSVLARLVATYKCTNMLHSASRKCGRGSKTSTYKRPLLICLRSYPTEEPLKNPAKLDSMVGDLFEEFDVDSDGKVIGKA